jgi:hypothetical protein
LNKAGGSQRLNYSFEAPLGQTIAVRVFDDNDNVAVKQIH